MSHPTTSLWSQRNLSPTTAHIVQIPCLFPLLCALVYEHFIRSFWFIEKCEFPPSAAPQHFLIFVHTFRVVILLPCQPSPTPCSFVGCHLSFLSFLLKIPSSVWGCTACWQRCFFPTCSVGSCLFLTVLDHQKGSMVIKANTVVNTSYASGPQKTLPPSRGFSLHLQDQDTT